MLKYNLIILASFSFCSNCIFSIAWLFLYRTWKSSIVLFSNTNDLSIEIAIHLHSEEDIENLENIIGKIYPVSSYTIPLAKQDKSRIVIKNVSPKISTEPITNYISRSASSIKVRRFFSSVNLNPLPIICITCDKQLAIK